jgi:hypothetical protein
MLVGFGRRGDSDVGRKGRAGKRSWPAAGIVGEEKRLERERQ